MTTAYDKELKAFQDIHSVLSPLDAEVRGRVLKAVVALLGMETANNDHQIEGDSTFLTFAELFDRANPSTVATKALVAGYWLQVCEGGETFTAQMVNKELTNLGHRIPNITSALESLKALKPSLALQLKKGGNSRQARKTYKLSASGEQQVKNMINGDDQIS